MKAYYFDITNRLENVMTVGVEIYNPVFMRESVETSEGWWRPCKDHKIFR